MPSIGPVEIFILLVLVLVVVVLGVIVGLTGVLRKGSGRRTGAVPANLDLEQLVVHLVRERRQIEAIKELRRHTGLGLADAKAVVDGVVVGRPLYDHPIMARYRPVRNTPLPPLPEDAPQDLPPDLATRVRRLKAAGRDEQAIFLVRGETGMEEQEARLFVDNL
ncbi:hypothetical protein GCM10009677_24160 [Sphaerisporangium rubeum]|uniref:Ribosomal protein L7/L12 C-terminal domain-containing protein n=1 Tax=Sphaerisporangium rubeum TaxID=321317 RepID=A0A7X0I9V1_9ACTN|nr:hypothetical protein [Sphaerisporangium rubeum]MBB6471128.1 hypothetical protein [Sphaerisporangium rubeum]